MWNKLFSWVRCDFLALNSFSDLVELVGQRKQKLDLFAVVAWYVWQWRNELRANKSIIPLQDTLISAAQLLTDFQKRRLVIPSWSLMSDSKWKPPNKDKFKTKYDGAVFQETNEAGIGVVIWNDEGEVLGALSEKIALPGSVVMVEMLAARRAIQFALEIGITHSVFEGDSENIYKALSTDVTPLSSFGHS